MTIELPSRSLAEYLSASGVVAICTVRREDGAHYFRAVRDVGRLASSGVDVIEAAWTASHSQALRVVRDAGKIAGDNADEIGAAAALGSSALLNNAYLTRHATVIARGSRASLRLDRLLREAAMQGVLTNFNAEFKRRRIEASTGGTSFMNYATARRRFRRVMIGRLIVSGKAMPADNLFREVFGVLPN